MCATHDSKAHEEITTSDLAAAIWLAVCNRLSADETVPVKSFIYDVVTTAIAETPRSMYFEDDPVFEDDIVKQAIHRLYREPHKQPFGFFAGLTATQQIVCSRPIGTEAADAYFEVLEERSSALARRWLQEALACPAADSDVMRCLFVSLKRALGQEVKLEAANQPTIEFTRDLLRAPASQASRKLVIVARDEFPDDAQRQQFAFLFAWMGAGTVWALTTYLHHLQHHGDPLDTLDGRRSAVSEGIIAAFQIAQEEDATAFAVRWLQDTHHYEAKAMSATPLNASFVGLQQALGLRDASLDYCHYNIIPRGLRQVLVTERMEALLAALPAAAASGAFVRSQTCRVMPAFERYARDIQALVGGAVWGLRLINKEVLQEK